MSLFAGVTTCRARALYLGERIDVRALEKAVLMSRAIDEHGRVQPLRNEWKRRYALHSFNHYNAVQSWRVHADGRVENCYV